MSIKDLIASATRYAIRQGFYGEGWSVEAKLTAIKGEVDEAQRAYDEREAPEEWMHYIHHPGMTSIPEGVGIELADVVLRVFSLAGKLGIDLEEMIRIKQEYNTTRPFLHAKTDPE